VCVCSYFTFILSFATISKQIRFAPAATVSFILYPFIVCLFVTYNVLTITIYYSNNAHTNPSLRTSLTLTHSFLQNNTHIPSTKKKTSPTQEKRVPVTIRYSQVSGLRSFYLTAVKKITQSNPDVIIERKILPFLEGESEESSLFEILVDGRVVIGKSRSKWQSVSRNVNGPATSGMSVFISMQEIDAAIAKARRKRRPSTAYVPVADIAEEGGTPAIRLEMLKVGRNGKEEEHWEEQQS